MKPPIVATVAGITVAVKRPIRLDGEQTRGPQGIAVGAATDSTGAPAISIVLRHEDGDMLCVLLNEPLLDRFADLLAVAVESFPPTASKARH